MKAVILAVATIVLCANMLWAQNPAAQTPEGHAAKVEKEQHRQQKRLRKARHHHHKHKHSA